MPLSADVTRYEISLGVRDGTTGWHRVDLTPSTIKMKITDQGAQGFYLPAGYHGQTEALGQAVDPVAVYDHILTPDGRRYEVKYIHPVWDMDNFIRRDCALSRIDPLWQAVPTSGATWKTGPTDPRSKTKAWSDANVRDAQILKDDGVTQAAWETIFADPPYPLALEFRGTSNVHGLYCIGRPSSTTPEMDALTLAPSGYEEQLPITILTVDSTGVTGTQLNWRMEEELRYCFENFPTGSLLSSSRISGRPVHLGSVTLYETEVTLNYRRDTTT